MKQPLNEQFCRMQKLAGILNENEDKAPLTITVKVTEEGKKKMRLYTDPSQIEMTGGESHYYYIGNTKAELGKETNIYFATYRNDIEEIQMICLVLAPGNGKFNELVKSDYLNSNEIKNLPSDIKQIEGGDYIFRQGEYAKAKGVVVGGTDHRGYFEIVSIP